MIPRSARLLPFVLAAALLAACSSDAPVAPTPSSPRLATGVASGSDVVPGQYIVLFRPVASNLRGTVDELTAKAAGKVAAVNGRLLFTYGSVARGFSAQLSDSAVAALRLDPEVASVTADPVFSVSGTQTNAPWGLDRIDQAALPLSTTYGWTNDGTGVTVYIVDTGINIAHTDFGGRAVTGYDAVTVGGTAADCHGHGTHVAGTVGGTNYGVAKNVRLVAVRVLDCSGNGSGSGILAGLDWIVRQKQAAPAAPMVVNMSLGGNASDVLDNAVAAVVNAGITSVVAAGNSATNACTTSPARLASAITVAATDVTDKFASFSNYGTCVDIAAPGVNIVSDYYGNTTGAWAMSGTSMATPHVAGAAALYLQTNGSASPAAVAAALTTNAVSGVITSVPASTANKLLNVSFLSPTPPPTLSVAPRGASVAVGATATFTATIGNPVAGATLSWASRNAAIATIAAAGTTTATATAVGAGTTYLVASYVAGATTLRDSVPFTVTPAAAGLLISASGNGCLTTESAAATRATLTPCVTGASTQLWTLPSTGVAGTVKLGGLCLDAWGAAGAIGTTIGTYSCLGGAANQQWTYTAAGEIRGQNGYCATVTAGSPITLLLGVCDGSAGQRWTQSVTAPAAPSVVSATGSGCLAAENTSASRTTVAPCMPGSATQLWSLPAVDVRGTIQVGGLCLDAWGATGAIGTTIGTYSCLGDAANQQWTYTAAGEIRGQNGYCATVTAGSPVTLLLGVCNGSAGQRWTRQ